MCKREESEKYLERCLASTIKARGGHALKFASMTETGYPDRLVLLPGGRVCFVELKSTGKKLRPLQVLRKKELEGLGFRVFVIDSLSSLKKFFDGV